MSAPARKAELRERWRIELDVFPTCAVLERRGTWLALASGEGELALIDVQRGLVGERGVGHEQGCFALAWSPSGGRLLSGGADGHARLFELDADAGRLRPLAGLPGGRGWVEHVAWSPCGTALAFASGRTLRLATAEGAAVDETPPAASTIAGLCWSPHGGLIAASGYGGVAIWSASRAFAEGPTQQLCWAGSLLEPAWSPNARVIACASQEATIQFWRLPSGEDSRMAGFGAKPRPLAWSPDSLFLACGGEPSIAVWSFVGEGPEGKRPLVLDCHRGPVAALAYASGGRLLASGARDGGVVVWKPRDHARPFRYAFMDEAPTQLVWTPSGELIGCDEAGGLVCWEATK